MTQQQRLKLAAVLLFLPLLVLGSIALQNEREVALARSWRVKIAGYDPRDLLYGHYLNFRFDWGSSEENNACVAGQSCCLCLGAQLGSAVPLASFKSCQAAAQCETALSLPNRVGCESRAQSCPTNPDAFNPEGVQRYFIPEESATQLNALLVNRQYNLTVELNIAPSGQHFLGDLYIDDVEWRDYLRQHPDAGRAESTQTHTEHTWRMKINEARLYGDYLVFRLNWGAPLTRSACPEASACCALCLSAQAGSSEPAVRYKACEAQDQCLESLILPDTNQPNRADRGFDANGPQKYRMSAEEAERLAPVLTGPVKDLSIDVQTGGWGGAPTFGELYINGIEWRDYVGQGSASRRPAAKGGVKK